MANTKKIFSNIYDQYVDKIYRFIFIKVNSQEIAEDLCSETFLRGWEVFKRAQNPQPNEQRIENPQAFLYKIARNLIIDHYREKGKAKIISAEYASIIDPRGDLEEKAISRSDLDNIRQALTGLKEDYQDVIIWHYLDDMPIGEIAKLLDRTEPTTRVLLHRALNALRTAIKGA